MQTRLHCVQLSCTDVPGPTEDARPNQAGSCHLRELQVQIHAQAGRNRRKERIWALDVPFVDSSLTAIHTRLIFVSNFQA